MSTYNNNLIDKQFVVEKNRKRKPLCKKCRSPARCVLCRE